ncbi:hypothetical protein GN956_G21209 [Arapaima gigas]
MSQTGPSAPPLAGSESSSIANITPLLLLLVPSVLLLLLLNCLFLGYKLLLLARRRKKRRRRLDSESTLLRCTLSRMAEGPSFVRGNVETGMDPVNPSFTSSKERAAASQRLRNTRPDGATGRGSDSLRAPSTIVAMLSGTESTARAELPPRSQVHAASSADWRRGNLLDSDTDRGNPVPPNSPEPQVTTSTVRNSSAAATSKKTECETSRSVRPLRRSSTMELKDELVHMGANSSLDLQFHCGYTSSIPPENSCFVTSPSLSTVGPGFDSDFGASAGKMASFQALDAGVSLRILSCDSEGLTEAILASGLEWDYYDPCYVSQNHIPRHMFQMPTVTTKQYWV